MKANVRCFLSDEAVLQPLMVIMAHCRITTISQSHSLRFLSVPAVKQLALHDLCSYRRSNNLFVVLLRWESPDALGQSLVGELNLFVCV